MEKPLQGHKQSHRKLNIKGTITNCHESQNFCTLDPL